MRLWRRELAADDDTAGQRPGKLQFAADSNGVVYPSGRNPGGQCLAAFRPRAVGLPRPDRVLQYHGNGRWIDRVFDYRTEVWTDHAPW